MFKTLETIHGELLLRAGLGSIQGITASKEGLSYTEVEDLLSCNERVLDSIYQYWTPPIRRIPPLIWLRINDELKEYMVEKSSGSTAVYGWYHRQFAETANERYCADPKIAAELHKAMAVYFGGFWSGEAAKPHITVPSSNNESEFLEAIRYVQEQPLYVSQGKPNHRKLAELPYHQSRSGLIGHLNSTLFNFEFIQAKCSAGLTYSLLADYEQAIVAVSAMDKSVDSDLSQFATFVRQHAASLVEYPFSANQLAIFQADHLRPAQQAKAQWDRKKPLALWTNKIVTENSVIKTLPHDAPVTAAAFSEDWTKVATADGNHNVLLWNYSSGRLLTTLKGHSDKIVQIHWLADNTTLISFSINRQLIIWDTTAMNIKFIVNGFWNPRWSSKLDNAFSFIVSKDQKYVASGYGNIVEVWEIATGQEATKVTVTHRGYELTDVQVRFLPDSSKITTAYYDEDSCYTELALWDIKKGVNNKFTSAKLPFGEVLLWSDISASGTSLLVATESGNFSSWKGFSEIVADLPTMEFKQWLFMHNSGKFTSLPNPKNALGLVINSNIVSVIDTAANARNMRALSTAKDFKIHRAAFSNNGLNAALLCSDDVLRVINTSNGNVQIEIPVIAGKAICFPAIAFSDTDQLKVIIPTGGALTIRTWDAFLKELPAVNVALPKDAIVDSLKLSSTAKYGVVSFNVKSQFDIKIFTNDVVNPLLSLHAEKDEYSVEFSRDDKTIGFTRGAEVELFSTSGFTQFKHVKLDRSLPRNHVLSAELAKVAYFEKDGIVVHNLLDNSKLASKSPIYAGDLKFSVTGNYLLNWMYDFGGIDIVDTTSGVHAQLNSGVDRVFIAGNKGLCVDKEGVLYFLALDF